LGKRGAVVSILKGFGTNLLSSDFDSWSTSGSGSGSVSGLGSVSDSIVDSGSDSSTFSYKALEVVSNGAALYLF